MAKTLRCLFTCELCGLVDAETFVPERKRSQSVTHWMEKVCLPTIGDAHHLLSPNCRPKKLTNLKIPMENDKGVGFAKED